VFAIVRVFAALPPGWRLTMILLIFAVVVIAVMWWLRFLSSKPLEQYGPKPLPGADPRASKPPE
jgi:hypothetical protein